MIDVGIHCFKPGIDATIQGPPSQTSPIIRITSNRSRSSRRPLTTKNKTSNGDVAMMKFASNAHPPPGIVLCLDYNILAHVTFGMHSRLLMSYAPTLSPCAFTCFSSEVWKRITAPLRRQEPRRGRFTCPFSLLCWQKSNNTSSITITHHGTLNSLAQ
jgi:hypothetical protein